MRKVKINDGYYSLDSFKKNVQFFIKKGNLFSHTRERLMWHFYPKLGIVSSFPTHVDIETSNLCQLKCPMCGRRKMGAGTGLMSMELYKSIIDQCAAEGVYSLKLSWRGEPLLNKEIFEMVRYAKEKKIKDVACLTNLERLTPEMAEKLVDSGMDWISVSIDGMYETYDKIRAPSRFENIVKQIKMIQDAKAGKKTDKPLIRIQSIRSAIKDDPFAYRDFWEQLVDKINFIADQTRYTPEKNFPLDENFMCQSPWLRMFISWDGKVGNCPVDYDLENVLGDVSEQPLKEIWQGPKYAELRKAHTTGEYKIMAPCNSCHKRGVLKEEVVKRKNEEIRMKSYVGQGIDWTKYG